MSLNQQQSNDVLNGGDISSQNISATNSSSLHTNLMPKEILMTGLGNGGTRPILFIRTETEYLVYQVSEYLYSLQI